MIKYLWSDEGVYVSKKAKHYLGETFDPNTIRKIAVIRHAALGDMIAARPFLVEARKYFPNAHITLCIDKKSKLGAPTDLADDVFYIYGEQGSRKIKDRYQSLRSLPPQDLLFDLASTNRSQLLSLVAKAKLKVGFPRRDLTRPLYDLCLKRNVFKYESESLLDQLAVLGHFSDLPLDFALPRYARGSNNIAFFTGASVAYKCYPLAQYQELIARLADHYPHLSFTLLEGVGEDEKSVGWEQVLERNNVQVQPLMTIDELTDYIAHRCELLICNDTGVRNIALATHTPTLGLFFGTLPQRYWPRYEPHFISYQPDRSVPPVEQVLKDTHHALEALGLSKT